MSKKTETFPIQKSEEEWRRQLDPLQYNVLRKHSTERAFTSPLNSEKRDGMFSCICCGKDSASVHGAHAPPGELPRRPYLFLSIWIKCVPHCI